mmetsp:Transcript_59731/g.94876  ORF Transcript_59731/g.94876 Transcript_59731/m.94876 type:complete len:472 (-) Transcript_59731:75-1490(-)
MELVNIPSTLEDPEYRYKMPRLISKFEGRGNAIKTCIVNMGDVARALHRPPQYATKWFGSALGVDSQFVKKEGDVEYCYINGSHDVSAFQSLLDEFIDKYVCCEQCRLPEVDMYISKGVVHGKCKACGWTNALDNKHRVAHFIAKHPPDESGFNLKGDKAPKLIDKADSDFSDFDLDEDFSDNGSGGTNIREGKDEQKEKKEKKSKKEKKEKKDKKHKKEKKDKKDKKEKSMQDETLSLLLTDEEASDKGYGGESDTEIDEESVNELPKSETISTWFKKDHDGYIDASETFDQQKPSSTRSHFCDYNSSQVSTAIKALQQYVKDEGELLTVDDFFDELRVAQLAEAFDHKVRLYVVLETFLGNNLDEQSVLTHKDHIEQAISSASMRGADVLWAFNAYLQAHPSGAKGFPLVLKTIYDEEWVFEKEFLEHYNCDKFEIDPGFQLAKEHAEPFLRWLGTFESDDEDNNNELV